MGRSPAHLREAPAGSPEPPLRSGQLGVVLRSVLLAPQRGFQAAVEAFADAGEDERGPWVRYFYLLGALGGAGLMSVWLKVSGLFDLRRFPRSEFRWSYLLAAFALAAIVGIVAQFAWSAAGAHVVKLMGGKTSARELSIVWGAAAFPLALALLSLVPLDLLLVGPETFTTDRLGDPLSTAWVALSIALGVSLAAWWLFLLARGAEVAGGLEERRGVVVAAGGLAAIVVVVLSFRGLALALERSLR